MLLLFAGACLGHLALMIVSHNWWYGLALPRHSGTLIHLSHGLLILAFPLALVWAFGWDLAGLSLSSDCAVSRLLSLYVLFCVAVGFVSLPLNTVLRLVHLDPTIEKQSRVLDVAKHLGYRPAGTSKERLLTYLPGNEVFQVELVERTLHLPRLPAAWDGLTILHLSDLHFKGTPDRDYFRFVMDRCAEWQPDLVTVTGDIADSMHHMRWIVPILGRLRWRIAAFAILGNHDYWYDPPLIRRRLRRLSMHVPSNSWQQIEVRGEPLVVIGHEGPWFHPEPDLSACPREPFRLCLSHTPDNIRWAQRAGIDLMLSGHVHGGQIRFPLFGSVLVPSRYGRRYDCGVFDETPTLLHVSRGLSGDHPLRYLCRPEVTLLTLRRTTEHR
ncbi:MAG TPA: metallophosphoesterase [Gemmataceae bacterium]|nr:metallophosphoesterase [Gemmataceae bacterium]